LATVDDARSAAIKKGSRNNTKVTARSLQTDHFRNGFSHGLGQSRSVRASAQSDHVRYTPTATGSSGASSAHTRAVPLVIRAQKPGTDLLQTKTKIGQFGQALR
jgi:hypothetical protein